MQSTSLPIIATTSRVVTKLVDRLTGDRTDVPLLVAAATQHGLKNLKLNSRIMYGEAAWIEISKNNQTPIWTGCWGQHFTFWVQTELAETIDLNVSVSYRKRSHDTSAPMPLYSPPILWSKEIPSFYRYKPMGVAELDLTSSKDLDLWNKIKIELDLKCQTQHLNEEFPNEAILCPNRKVLDDSMQSFKHFERALSIHGLPQAPFG